MVLCFCPFRASGVGGGITRGAASLAPGWWLAALSGRSCPDAGLLSFLSLRSFMCIGSDAWLIIVLVPFRLCRFGQGLIIVLMSLRYHVVAVRVRAESPTNYQPGAERSGALGVCAQGDMRPERAKAGHLFALVLTSSRAPLCLTATCRSLPPVPRRRSERDAQPAWPDPPRATR